MTLDLTDSRKAWGAFIASTSVSGDPAFAVVANGISKVARFNYLMDKDTAPNVYDHEQKLKSNNWSGAKKSDGSDVTDADIHKAHKKAKARIDKYVIYTACTQGMLPAGVGPLLYCLVRDDAKRAAASKRQPAGMYIGPGWCAKQAV